jgi:hypothetical protein
MIDDEEYESIRLRRCANSERSIANRIPAASISIDDSASPYRTEESFFAHFFAHNKEKPVSICLT